ncbi:FecR domain-containing protein [Nitrosomonas sp.]|uniref:FecR family protein n=1 Tax=Nitrosomonas sp. TaxID=42353 RepID=UPI0025F8BF44|nr:FecR domain-containing protein [Nitrosomonas sp.]MCC6916960.1 FecR domain-containing protein [Nitrosomonas sp.]
MHSNSVPDSIVEQAAEWVVRLSENGLTSADRAALLAEFEQWQRINPQHARAANKMMGLVRQSEQVRETTHPTSARIAVEASLKNAHRATHAKKLGTVIMLMITLALPAWFFFQHYSPAYLLADTRTTTGQWHTQTLIDQSTVTLNSASATNFHFDAELRNIELIRGEILIDVAADPGRPFQVETRHGQIRALGTRFIVSLTDETTTLTMLESQAEIALFESDRRQTGNTAATLVLSAGQRVQFSDKSIGEIETVDTQELSDAWAFRHLKVNNRPLSEVLDRLSRYRTGLVLYNAHELERLRISAVLPLDDTDKALYLLTRSFPIRTYTITPWLLIVEPDIHELPLPPPAHS